VDSAGGAFLTIQKAETVARALDFNGQTVTVSIGNGTYTAGVSVGKKVGQAAPNDYRFTSTSGTASAVIVSVTNNNCFYCIADCRIDTLEMRTTTSGSCILADAPCVVNVNGVRFGVCATAHVFPEYGGMINLNGSYTITGNAAYHWNAGLGGLIFCAGQTVTLSGTPAFSAAFARAHTGGAMQVNGNTFSGSATGTRYDVNTNGAIQTFGGGATYLRSTATGGTYS
jgi:hypothetical protein